VAALQTWGRPSGSVITGLVWVGSCLECGAWWAQLSATQPSVLHENCDKCSGRAPLFDGRIAEAFAAAPPEGEARSQFEGRGGRIETHLEEVALLFSVVGVVTVDAFVQKAVDTLPAPRSGKRDVRRQQVVRAVYALNKKQNGPLRLEGENIIICP
jgi:hypothetical protein